MSSIWVLQVQTTSMLRSENLARGIRHNRLQKVQLSTLDVGAVAKKLCLFDSLMHVVLQGSHTRRADNDKPMFGLTGKSTLIQAPAVQTNPAIPVMG